jgi:hypothetical protein
MGQAEVTELELFIENDADPVSAAVDANPEKSCYQNGHRQVQQGFGRPSLDVPHGRGREEVRAPVRRNLESDVFSF